MTDKPHSKKELEIRSLRAKLRKDAQALFKKHPELEPRRPVSGVPGITWQPKFKAWVVHLHRGGKIFHCGLFKDIPSAIEALEEAKRTYGF